MNLEKLILVAHLIDLLDLLWKFIDWWRNKKH